MKFVINVRFFLCLVATLTAPHSFSNNEKDAKKLFSWFESKYSDVLGAPESPGSISRMQGYTYRAYPDSGIYLALYGDVLYGVGGALGPSLVPAGTTSTYITKTVTDLTDKNLSLRDTNCSYYASQTIASAKDLSTNETKSASSNITMDGESCILTSNSIPNHSFANAENNFAHTVKEVNAEYRIPSKPTRAAETTPLSLTVDNGVFLNGVKLDLIAAGCFGINDGNRGCNDMGQPWRYDPMSSNAKHNTDSHNGHSQANGKYHYHGDPNALFPRTAEAESPLIGFAADGFPIFGSYFKDSVGIIRAAKSSYQLRPGSRPTSVGSPGGTYDGTYRDDYQFLEGSGDLDECNGMTYSGQYGYYITNAFPWALNCFKGTPDSSFNKSVQESISQTEASSDDAATSIIEEDSDNETSSELIKILNFSRISTANVERYVKAATGQVETGERNIIVAAWSIGPMISEGGFAGYPYNKHQVIISASEIDSIVSEVKTWYDASCPIPEEYRNFDEAELEQYRGQEIAKLRVWLEKGAGVASQFDYCPEGRVSLIAVEPTWDTGKASNIIVHETYHALQTDLANESCRDLRESDPNSNNFWIIEGTAHYFANMTNRDLGIKNSSGNNGLSEILEDALTSYQRGDTDLSTIQGAAALALMVARGELDEKLILNGGMFLDCLTETAYKNDNESVANAKKSWFLIERSANGTGYQFSADALK